MLRLITAAILVAALAAALPLAHAQGSDGVSGHYRDATTGVVIDLAKGVDRLDKDWISVAEPDWF